MIINSQTVSRRTFAFNSEEMQGPHGSPPSLSRTTPIKKGIMSLFGRIFRKVTKVSDSSPDEQQVIHTVDSNAKSSPKVQDPQRVNPYSATQLAIRHIIFWRTGFTIENGPLHLYSDAQNERILMGIQNGAVHADLLNVAHGQPVELRVPKKLTEDYVPPPSLDAGDGLPNKTQSESSIALRRTFAFNNEENVGDK